MSLSLADIIYQLLRINPQRKASAENVGTFMPVCCFSLIFISYIYMCVCVCVCVCVEQARQALAAKALLNRSNYQQSLRGFSIIASVLKCRAIGDRTCEPLATGCPSFVRGTLSVENRLSRGLL